MGAPRVVAPCSAGRPALRAHHGAYQPHARARAGVRPRGPGQGVVVGARPADRDVPGTAQADHALVERGGLQVERQAPPADQAGEPSVHRRDSTVHRSETISSTGREVCHWIRFYY